MENCSYIIDRFDECQVLRYDLFGFDELPLDEKIYIYYLSKATVAGQIITFDQNFKHNTLIYKSLRSIIGGYKGTKEGAEWEALVRYTKHIWFANGIHHHYSGEKFTPEFTEEFFRQCASSIVEEAVLELITPIIFDKELYRWRVTRNEGVDVVAQSACNYYSGVTTTQAQGFYENAWNSAKRTKLTHPLNSHLTLNEDGELTERVYRSGEMYGEAIDEIMHWLRKAARVANDKQREIISLLIEYYTTGDPKLFDDYSIAWLRDDESRVDFINGFIEVYGDPIGLKGAWEGLVNYRNVEASRRTEIISENAQWFEDHSPINPLYRKSVVTGVSAKVVTVAMLGGDCYPSTPIGINLPNAEWIRRDYGSKSITIDNITHAYDQVSQHSGFVEEFFCGESIQSMVKQYGKSIDDLHTDLHECVGHGSGRLADGVSQEALGCYGSVIEECRADLYGLYYMGDARMVELGLVPCADAVQAYYTKYLTNGLLTQLSRIKLGDNVEQTHMRCRKVISQWVLDRASAAGVAQMQCVDGYSYIVVNDSDAVREIIGQLLYEVQRIKSEGDQPAAKELVESLGVLIDPQLHAEVLSRYERLNIAPYNGFVNPLYTPIFDENRKIVDIKIDYPSSIW